jgi:hypothetical protein
VVALKQTSNTEPAFARLRRGRHGTYRWIIQTPVRNYYGEDDEVISVALGGLAMTYQRAIGNERVEAISTGNTNHRGTFARAVPQWKRWFDTLSR